MGEVEVFEYNQGAGWLETYNGGLETYNGEVEVFEYNQGAGWLETYNGGSGGI